MGVGRTARTGVALLAAAGTLLSACGLLSPSDVVRTDRTPPTAASNTTTTTEAPRLRYEVVRGDTLIGIANRFDLTLDQLAAANNIADPTFITVGQVLLIPSIDDRVPPAFTVPPPTDPVLPTVLPTLPPETTSLWE